eukprot:TRINITY_DN7991_c0_g1_i2.p1 TRINITY_DN7991_c0_g1~~TRINITY_DN7991_c0_g1_i2.p1  ORF type:complete len:460 (-),score=99.84 TRINITY_DN7991_c0_g1_i2:560-1939(-)
MSKQFIHDILLALLGHCGDVIVSSKSTFHLSTECTHVDESERQLINRICATGFYCLKLQTYCDRTQSATAAQPLFLRALCSGIEEQLDAYRQKIVEAEETYLGDAYLSLSYLFGVLGDYPLVFPYIAGIVDQITDQGLGGGALLNLLHEKAMSGFPSIRDSVLRLTFHVHKVFYNILGAWMLYGLLQDKYGEFFIRDTSVQSNKEAATVVPTAAVDASVSTTASSAAPATNATPASDNKWTTQYTVEVRQLPQYVPASVAQTILFIGKAVQVLQNPTAAKFGTPPADAAERFREKLRKLQSMAVFHPLSFEVEIASMRAAVAKDLWQLVVVGADLMSHFRTLKDYFLLAKGDFYQIFLEDAYKVLAMPPGPTAERQINVHYQAASGKSTAEDDEHFKLLNMKFDKDFPARDPWGGLYLQYRVQFPLDMLISEDTIQKYVCVQWGACYFVHNSLCLFAFC